MAHQFHGLFDCFTKVWHPTACKVCVLSNYGSLARRKRVELAECMVRRLTAREKLMDEESLRQCIRQ
jgi:hypothetical protein